jgi:hypothetical protein
LQTPLFILSLGIELAHSFNLNVSKRAIVSTTARSRYERRSRLRAQDQIQLMRFNGHENALNRGWREASTWFPRRHRRCLSTFINCRCTGMGSS